MSSVLIRGARQVLTLRGCAGPRRGLELENLGIVQNGAVLVEDGLIREVGPTRRVENLEASRQATIVDAANSIVLPGFIDCHTDLITSAVPFVPDFPEPSFGSRMMWPLVDALRQVSVALMKSAMLESLALCAKHGTTTVQLNSGFGLNEAAEVNMLRVFASLSDAAAEAIAGFHGAHLVPNGFEGKSVDYMDWLCAKMLPLVARRRLAVFAHATCEEGSFGEVCLQRYLARAASLGLATRVHFAQFGATNSIRFALEARASSVDHLDFASHADLEAIAISESIAVLLPAVSFYLGRERFVDARRLVDFGAAIALGTGYNQLTAPGSNMQFAIFLACRKLGLSPAEAISAATINAAHVLKIAYRTGSIEPGKQADLIVLNTPDYRALGHGFGVNLVSMTMKRGEVVYRSASGT